jgi:hypothetical protein
LNSKNVKIEYFPLQAKEESFISLEALEDIVNDLGLENDVKEKIFSHEFILNKLAHQLEIIDESINSVFTESVLIEKDAYELIKIVGSEKLLEKLKVEYINAMNYLFGYLDFEDMVDMFMNDVKIHIEENINQMEKLDTETIYQWHTNGQTQGWENLVDGTLEFQIRVRYDGEYCVDGLYENYDFEINKIWNLKQHEIVEGITELDDSEEAIKEYKRRIGEILE